MCEAVSLLVIFYSRWLVELSYISVTLILTITKSKELGGGGKT
jgi:hypothetical protein